MCGNAENLVGESEREYKYFYENFNVFISADSWVEFGMIVRHLHCMVGQTSDFFNGCENFTSFLLLVS